MMNIAVANDFFPPKVAGGADLFLGELSKYLSRDNEVTVITSQLVEGSTNFRTYKIKSSPFQFDHMQQIPGLTLPWLFRNSSLKEKLKKIYRKEKVDVVYLNNLYHLSFAPLQAAHDLGIRTVLDVHDYWPVCFSKDKYRNNRKTCEIDEGFRCSFCLGKKFDLPFLPFVSPFLCLEKVYKKKLLRKIDGFISHSKFVSEELKKRGYESEAIPYPYFGEIPEEPEKETESFRIVFAGRLTQKKGADLCLSVARFLKGKVNFRIDVLGDGHLFERLNREDLNVYTHGFLEEERFEYFKKADLMLAPSRWPEPFGIVALEAMAYRIPLVTLKNSGGLKDLVKKNGTGIVTTEEDLRKGVLRLIRNEKELERIKGGCSGALKNYRKEDLFPRYLEYIEG